MNLLFCFDYRLKFRQSLVFTLLVLLPSLAWGQDRLRKLPEYQQYRKVADAMGRSIKWGNLAVQWQADGKAFEYRKDGKYYRYDLTNHETTEIDSEEWARSARRNARNGRPSMSNFAVPRGRQVPRATSPNEKFEAFYREQNLWLRDAEKIFEMPITTAGSKKDRIKYGTASWVYGEELGQRTAMWWSPDSANIAFYRFDESQVPDYYLTFGQTKLRSTIDVEAYPKVGDPNPVVDLLIYDLRKRNTVQVDVRSGEPFEDEIVGYYVYRVQWSPDGKELLFCRTNRFQNAMELVAANPETGKCRVIVREQWPASWVSLSPRMQFLADGKRFIWTSERTGWKNFYLYHLDGTLLAKLTGHEFEVADIVRIDEEAGKLYYMARSGDNPMKLQLHRVGLDGTGDVRLTDPAFHHSVRLAPDGSHFVDTIQTHDTPPATRLVDAEGNVVKELATSDASRFDELGFKRVELLKFKAADGETDLYGMLHRPSTFDPNKKYPLLVSVYAGPATNGARETFALPSALAEFGFLVASFDSRSAAGRGKKFLDAIYMKLGRTEIDDQAAGVKSLWDRPYVDKERVGIFGTSYGGTASILCLLRYPEVFHAASASSALSDFRNYDTIYTERYMRTSAANEEGYEAACTMNYVDNLKGRLMLFFGTTDNNVHPSNTLQLVSALQRAGKSFDLQVGPDQGHAALHPGRMMEFFMDSLGTVDRPPLVHGSLPSAN